MSHKQKAVEQLPDHVQDTVRSSAELHNLHYNDKTVYQRMVDTAIARLGEPFAIGTLLVAVALWVAVNTALPKFHATAFDPYPFSLLQCIASVAALSLTIMILTNQQNENRLAEQRARLDLELSMVNDKKVAKLISLLEGQRRDNPLLTSIIDPEAEDMARPADPHVIFDAIKESHADHADL